MPEGLIEVIGLLSLGYILLLIELFVPGGILGILGGLAMAYGCYMAFDLGTYWGLGSIGLSLLVTVVLVVGFVRSRTAHRLILSKEEGKTWKAADLRLPALAGKEGTTLSALRPAGLAEIDGERVDVVSDSEFLDAGVAVRVIEVAGTRVVVEAVEGVEADTNLELNGSASDGSIRSDPSAEEVSPREH